MEPELKDKIDEIVEDLNTSLSKDDIDFQRMDPVAKLMFVALVDEMQKIEDSIQNFEDRIIERYCSNLVAGRYLISKKDDCISAPNLIPGQEFDAKPAITLVCPVLSSDLDAVPEKIETSIKFSYSYKTKDKKQAFVNFIPLFESLVIPYAELVYPRKIAKQDWAKFEYKEKNSNILWVGITTEAKIESLCGLNILINGTHGVCPEHIFVGDNEPELHKKSKHDVETNNLRLSFATISEMECINMLPPFKTTQNPNMFFSIMENWKEAMLNMEDSVWLCVTDEKRDKDGFKKNNFPQSMRDWMESNSLNYLKPNAIWLRIDFPEGYVVPDNCEIQLNVIPMVNIELKSLTLTEDAPIDKLQNNGDSYFLGVLQPCDKFVIRDFDANCYNSGDLYRDVRNLYHRFFDDYFAFAEFNDIRDESTLIRLREIIKGIKKATSEKPHKESGLYVMKTWIEDNDNNYCNAADVDVDYLVTQGEKGNSPKKGDELEYREKSLIFKKEVKVVVSAMGGADKTSDKKDANKALRRELLRYYSLTGDRLYTKMDIDAFLRKEIVALFGKEESERISFEISIHGAGGQEKVQRGLYIDISFKDQKNYEKAQKTAFDKIMQQRIENKSCIAMPIIVTLKGTE